MANHSYGDDFPGISPDSQTNSKSLRPYKPCCFYRVQIWIHDGFSFCCIVFVVNSQSIKKPRLFWVSAAAPLTSVITSTLLLFCLRSRADKIPKVRMISSHHPPNRPTAFLFLFLGLTWVPFSEYCSAFALCPYPPEKGNESGGLNLVIDFSQKI